MTMLREIRIVGPDCFKGPLWSLSTDVLYGGPGDGDGRLVDNVAGLRGLTLAGEAQTVKSKHDGTEYAVHPPTLMQAKLRFEKGRKATITAPDASKFKATTFEHKDEPDKKFDVLLGPIGDWTDVEFVQFSEGGRKRPQITIPDMRCVAGAIDLHVPEKSGLAKFLHYDKAKGTVLFGRSLKNKESGLQVTLVPEGIEIDLSMPHPFRDITAETAEMKEIPVRVRIEPDRNGFQARLIHINTKAMALKHDLVADFSQALTGLKSVNSPILAESDTRISLPPFSWRLDLDDTGLHVNPQDGSGDQWRIKVDPALIVVRLETDIGPSSTRPAIARLDLDERDADSGLSPRLDLVRNDKGTTLRYALKADATTTFALNAHYDIDKDKTEKPFQFSHIETSEELPAYTPLDEAATRRRQPQGTQRSAILPVNAGTLQIEVTPDPKPPRPITPRRSALQGNCVFKADRGADRFLVELNDAGETEAAVTWKNFAATAISLGFSEVTGALRGALWTAEEAPNPDRLLPTGRLDPASLRELAPVFGQGLDHNTTLEFAKGSGDAPANWSLSFMKDQTAYLWTATDGLPLVTAAPMLAAGKGDKPSELRSLLPVRLDASLKLTSGRGVMVDLASRPAAETALPWPWPEAKSEAAWGVASVQMVSPVAPGLDYHVPPNGLPDDRAAKVSLRYDLPVLDELFAGATAEEPEQDAKTQLPLPPGAVAGVLDFAAMKRLWDERKFQLAATRTQDARATGWAKHDNAVPGPIKLAAPYDADATVAFSTNYALVLDDNGNQANIPFGGYAIAWKGTTATSYSGELALLGPMGGDENDRDKPLPLTIHKNGLKPTGDQETADMIIAGFAPDAYKTEIGLADTRGTSMQTGVTRDDKGASRAAGFLSSPGGKTDKTTLYTHASALEVKGLGGDTPVRFWVRDLPLTNGAFDANTNPVEGSIGPDPSPFEAAALQSSLYEWRLFEDHGADKPATFTIRYGWLELAPLRLLSYTPGGDALIVFRASLAASDATRRPVEAPYDTGPLVVLQLETTGDEMQIKEISAARLKPHEDPKTPLFKGFVTLQNGDLKPSDDRISFTFDADLSLAVADQSDSRTHQIGVRLSGKPTKIKDAAPVNIELDFEMMDRRLSLSVTEEFPGVFKYTGPDTKPTLAVWIETATLTRDNDQWRLDISLGVHAALRKNGPAVLESNPAGLRWLSIDGVAPDHLQVDIGRGSLWIERRAADQNVPGSVAPIVGIGYETVETLDYSAALALDTRQTPSTEPVWDIAAATILAEIAGNQTAEIDDGQARAIQTESLTLRSQTTCQDKTWHSRITLDRDLTKSVLDSNAKALSFQTSGISWDPDGITIAPRDKDELFQSATFTIEKAKPYQHDVNVVLRDHSIPPDALELKDGSICLSQSIPLSLLVRHQLSGKDKTISWRTVESAVLTTEALWKSELAQKEVFGPRYVNSNAAYRLPDSPRPDVAGIGSRAAMLSGFDDAAFTKDLMEDRSRLILLGGTPGLLDVTDVRQLFGLPWVISFNSAQALPDQFRDLMQFSDAKRTWKAAQFDGDAFTLPTGALPTASGMPLNLLSGDDIEGFFASLSSENDFTADIARMTEQTYVEPEKPADGEVRQDWPFFLKALVGLKAGLKNTHEAWDVISLATPTESEVFPVALPGDDIDTHVPKPPARRDLRLMTVSADGQIRLFPLQQESGALSLQELSEQLGTVRQSELAMARDAGLQLAGLVEVAPRAGAGTREILRRARSIRLTDMFDEFGRFREHLIDPGTQLYASPALGWPGSVAHAKASDLAMVGVADAPVVSSEAGLTARSAALASGPAIARDMQIGRYLVTQSRSVFDHGKGYATATLPAPPAKHLALLPPRVRTPLPERRKTALAQLLGAAQETLGLIPPAYGRGYVGARPGTLHSFADALLTDGAEAIRQIDNAPEFGRPAILAPVLARQLRTPRSPALPTDEKFDLDLRRRTYVSVPDNEADKDKTVMIRDNAAAMWRGEKTRFVLDLNTISIDPGDVLEKIEDGSNYELDLRLWYKGEDAVMTALAKSGFLRPDENKETGEKKEDASLRAWLALGDQRLNADRISWDVPDGMDHDVDFGLTLAFANIALSDLLEQLRDPDPDTPAYLHFFFRHLDEPEDMFDRKGNAVIAPAKEDSLKPGIPTAITLPIGRKPLGRLAPDIRRRTYIFADPAFDRVLSSPGKSSQIVRIPDDNAAVLAVDRTEYDLSQTLYFAFGFLGDDGFEDSADLKGSLKLKLKPQTEPGVEPETIDLKLEGIATGPDLDPTTAYALPLSRLKAAESTVVPQAGDQLLIEVALAFGGKHYTVSVEFPIAKLVADPRPAAVYSVLGLSEDKQTRTLLHASAPAPDRIEFVDLLEDLPSGHIRKRAIFEWYETDLADAPDYKWRTLTKTDRSGGAQLPSRLEDFTPPLTADDLTP